MTNSALWQVQSGAANGTEATAGDTNTVDFADNDTSKNPSAGAFISDIDVTFRRAVPENEAVDADNNELQDMGIDGLVCNTTLICPGDALLTCNESNNLLTASVKAPISSPR